MSNSVVLMNMLLLDIPLVPPTLSVLSICFVLLKFVFLNAGFCQAKTVLLFRILRMITTLQIVWQINKKKILIVKMV